MQLKVSEGVERGRAPLGAPTGIRNPVLRHPCMSAYTCDISLWIRTFAGHLERMSLLKLNYY